MRRMLWTTVVALAVAQGAEAFDVVRDGRCAVRFAGVADGAERAFATNEFFRVVRTVTGAEPMADAPNEIAFRVDPSLGPSDTYEIRVEKAAAGERLWLAGNSDVSCWFAMVDLLEQLGCRWFWPGADGEYLPDATRNLSLAVTARLSTAALPNRAFSFHLTRSRDAREKHAFTRHQRLHPVLKWGGHSFNWVLPADCRTPDEYFAKYPEQYALWKGARSPKQHCYTNPDTIRTFVGWLVRLCDAHPEVERFSLSPKDVPIHCQCAACAAADPSTTYFSFVNKVVAEVVKARPGRKFSTIAYSFYLNVPKVRIHPAIAVDYCMYNRCYMHPFGAADCPLNPKALAAMADWKAVLSGAPGVYGIADASEVDRVLGYPAAEIAKIDSAASLVHMMNLNTFTAGAYHVVSGTDTAALASAIEKNIQSRQWMCGFPDKLIVVSAGSCLVSAFGAEDLVNTFRDKIVAAYADAQVLVDAPIDA